MHAANSIQVPASNFEAPSRLWLFAEKVRPHSRHSHLHLPSASQPRFMNASYPHRGQLSGTPRSAPDSSSASASLSAFSSSIFSWRASSATC